MKNTAKINCLFFIFFLTSFSQVHAQSYIVKGIVKNKEGVNIAGASVKVDSDNYVYETDSLGYFTVSTTKGYHAIEIKFLSFLPERPFINVVSDTIINVTMTEVVNQLEQAIITADRTTENVRKPVLGVLQINNKVLKKIPAAFGGRIY